VCGSHVVSFFKVKFLQMWKIEIKKGIFCCNILHFSEVFFVKEVMKKEFNTIEL